MAVHGLSQGELLRLRRLFPYDPSRSAQGRRAWRSFMVRLGLVVYVTELEYRGVKEVQDLKLLSDEVRRSTKETPAPWKGAWGGVKSMKSGTSGRQSTGPWQVGG